MANRFQEALLRAYEVGTIDPDKPDDVDAMVRRRETGDTLFDFLWIELSDKEDCDGTTTALARLAGALDDIKIVADAIAMLEG